MSESHWRLFVSISVPDAIKHEIERLQFEMRRIVAPDCVRWTGDQLHLTLRFLGNVATNKVEDLTFALRQATKACSSFGLRARRVGFFPPKRFPRVIWIGIESEHDELLKLQFETARASEPFTDEREDRTFSGHLTLGRVKRIGRAEAEQLWTFAEKLGDRCFGDWKVESVELMRSELDQAGARHTRLAQFPLHGCGTDRSG